MTFKNSRFRHNLYRVGILVRALFRANDEARTRIWNSIHFRLRKYQAFGGYKAWHTHLDTPKSKDIQAIKGQEETSKTIFILAKFSRETSHLAEATANALKNSIGQRWQATFSFAQDCSEDHISGFDAATRNDARFHSKSAEPAIAEGDVIVVLRGGALPRTHSLFCLNKALSADPDALIAYSDEDSVVGSEIPHSPWFKPNFSPLLAVQGVLLGGMVALRVSGPESDKLFARLLRIDTDVLLTEMALAAGETGVIHIPHVLFHNAVAAPAPRPLALPALPEPLPIASILIPTRDGWSLLGPCLESLKQTNWPKDRLEIIVIDNGTTDPETLEGLTRAESEGHIRILHDPSPFNYSRLNNMAARAAKGDLLVLLNNDTEIIDADWLRKLASYAMQPGAGAVGPKLLYADRTVQHGGVIGGLGGLAGHAHLNLGENEPGYNGLANLTHEVLAVTGACLAISKQAYEAVGGLREDLQVAFNDVALCFDLHKAGLRSVYYAEPLLLHYESKTRGFDNTPEKLSRARREARVVHDLHPDLPKNDPFYSPNLAFEAAYELSWAPRRLPLWRYNLKRPRQVALPVDKHQPQRPGTLFIGYAEGALGLGHAFRSELDAAQTVGMEFSIYPFRINIETRLLPPYMPERYDRTHIHDINVIEIAADQLPFLYNAVNPALLKNSYNILRTYWELAAAPEEWRHHLSAINEIWAPNSFVAQSFKPIFDGPIKVIEPVVSVEGCEAMPRSVFGMKNERFYFLFSFDFFSSAYRKNPQAVLDAFRQAFPMGSENVGLVIKSNGPPSLCPDFGKQLRAAAAADNRIIIIDGHVSREKMLGLIQAADVYVSLHRAEGFGLGMAEAMSLGKSVIGTGYSGNADFLTDETGFPVPYSLKAIAAHEYAYSQGQYWADPDVKAAADIMRRLAEDPSFARNRCLTGQKLIRTHYGSHAVGERMMRRLDEIRSASVSSKGASPASKDIVGIP